MAVEITSTYVKSINGYSGTRPFMTEGLNVFTGEIIEENDSRILLDTEHSNSQNVTIDAGDIKVNNNAGNSIRQAIQTLGNSMKTMYIDQIGNTNDYEISFNAPMRITTA